MQKAEDASGTPYEAKNLTPTTVPRRLFCKNCGNGCAPRTARVAWVNAKTKHFRHIAPVRKAATPSATSGSAKAPRIARNRVFQPSPTGQYSIGFGTAPTGMTTLPAATTSASATPARSAHGSSGSPSRKSLRTAAFVCSLRQHIRTSPNPKGEAARTTIDVNGANVPWTVFFANSSGYARVYANAPAMKHMVAILCIPTSRLSSTNRAKCRPQKTRNTDTAPELVFTNGIPSGMTFGKQMLVIGYVRRKPPKVVARTTYQDFQVVIDDPIQQTCLCP